MINTFEPFVLAALVFASFVASFITVALGIGGGALLLTILATFIPPTALIPVHGLIQLGSNIFRATVLSPHINWAPIGGFGLGTLFGVALGGGISVNLPAALVQIGVGVFVIWSVLTRPPKWLSKNPLATGVISSFLTMFFGATGVFVANFSRSLNLPRQVFVATHASMMTMQHLAKVVVFGFLGFAFGPWLGFAALMIAAGFAGTLVGKHVLIRIPEQHFRITLNAILVLISLRLIWKGLADWV